MRGERSAGGPAHNEPRFPGADDDRHFPWRSYSFEFADRPAPPDSLDRRQSDLDLPYIQREEIRVLVVAQASTMMHSPIDTVTSLTAKTLDPASATKDVYKTGQSGYHMVMSATLLTGTRLQSVGTPSR